MPDLDNFWDVRISDDLDERILREASAFLQERLPEGAEKTWSSEYFRWKLEKNPSGKGFLSCAVSNGNVVGVTSITRKKAWYKGKIITVGEIGDTYTHPLFLKKGKQRKIHDGTGAKKDYYNKSIFGCLVKETRERALNEGINIIYGTPNSNSLAGYKKRLNFIVHPFNQIRTFIRPTARGLCSKYALLGPVYNSMAFAEKTFTAASFAYRKVIGRMYRYSFEKLEKPSDDIDELWGRLKDQYQFSLVHDKEFYQHRFFDHPLGTYHVYKVSRKGRPEGVIALRISTDIRGRKCCVLADWLYDESVPELFPIILSYVMQMNRQDDVCYFHAWSGQNSNQCSALKRQGFVSRNECPVIFYQNDEGSEIAEDCNRLNITLASTDNV